MLYYPNSLGGLSPYIEPYRAEQKWCHNIISPWWAENNWVKRFDQANINKSCSTIIFMGQNYKNLCLIFSDNRYPTSNFTMQTCGLIYLVWSLNSIAVSLPLSGDLFNGGIKAFPLAHTLHKILLTPGASTLCHSNRNQHSITQRVHMDMNSYF